MYRYSLKDFTIDNNCISIIADDIIRKLDKNNPIVEKIEKIKELTRLVKEIRLKIQFHKKQNINRKELNFLKKFLNSKMEERFYMMLDLDINSITKYYNKKVVRSSSGSY